ncbi:MAG: hypothetical protein GOVbin5978_25 [Prokaryotic dsDNA virus sp.]|nr:MAG: hypothetical protein GOVbin5978_25 [Prokaryotic dsDNA virus sp.]|tara:strand:- start:31603 stop:32568 length:966 start_codon:yes stop_codon:yes gene_type:complete
MANFIGTPISWSQEDAAKYFLQPLFISNNDLSHFDVMTNISGSSIKLDKYASISGVTKANGGGSFAAPAAALSNNTAVTLNLDRLLIESEQGAYALYNHIKSQLMKQGISRSDLTGTLLMEIVSELLMGGIMRDFSTILWWGDKTAGAGVAVQGLSDGIWKACDGVAAVAYTGVVLDDLADLMTNRSNELAASEQVMFVSRAFADQYRKELTEKSVQGAYQDLQGGIAQLSYNGIPMVVKPDFDVNIATYGATLSANSPSATTNTACAILLAKDAIAIGTDFEVQDVDMWYNRDEQKNRFRMNYSFGCALKDDSLVAKIVA